MAGVTTTLNSSLSSGGLSAADAGQLAATKDLVSKLAEQDVVSASADNTSSKEATSSVTLSPRAAELSAAEQRQIVALRATDAEVRAHEQAHINAGRGVVTSGPNYTYTYGPDGKQYAVAGEVGIDTSPEKKPEANIDKGQRIQSAALAPRQPSSQDYRVASVGEGLELRGRNDLAEEQRAERAAADELARAERAQSAEAAEAATEASETDKPVEPPQAEKANAASATKPATQSYLDLATLGGSDSEGRQVDVLA